MAKLNEMLNTLIMMETDSKAKEVLTMVKLYGTYSDKKFILGGLI